MSFGLESRRGAGFIRCDLARSEVDPASSVLGATRTRRRGRRHREVRSRGAGQSAARRPLPNRSMRSNRAVRSRVARGRRGPALQPVCRLARIEVRRTASAVAASSRSRARASRSPQPWSTGVRRNARPAGAGRACSTSAESTRGDRMASHPHASAPRSSPASIASVRFASPSSRGRTLRPNHPRHAQQQKTPRIPATSRVADRLPSRGFA